MSNFLDSEPLVRSEASGLHSSPKTFYVITEEYNYEDMDIYEKNVLYTFETHEEALYVLHLLEEDRGINYGGNMYTYDLSIVNNNHPYEKLSEEEMFSLRRERYAHKRAKEEILTSHSSSPEFNRITTPPSGAPLFSKNQMMKIQNEINKKKAEEEKQNKKKQEREAECQEYKEKIDEFMDWLQKTRNFIAANEPKQDDIDDDGEDDIDDDAPLYLIPSGYEYEANQRLSLIKNDIQQYLLDHQDEDILELVNKPIFELLNLPPHMRGSQNPSIYVPKKLRQIMEQDKKIV